ncbi:unnamed protein product, partial [Mesorhabditis spiculigera]
MGDTEQEQPAEQQQAEHHEQAVVQQAEEEKPHIDFHEDNGNVQEAPVIASHDDRGDRQDQRSRSRSRSPRRDRGDRDRGHDRGNVCRDFLKNICNRGSNCKFYHPPDHEQKPNSDQVNFCIDYQNRGCTRHNCRFVHVPKEEAERYKATREVTLPLARAIAAVSQGDMINGIPVCKEYQTGKCNRGAARCRYWHVNLEEERERRRRGYPAHVPLGGGGGGGGGGGRMGGGYGGGGGGGMGGGYGGGGMRRGAPPLDDYYEPKRSRMMEDQRLIELQRRCSDYEAEILVLKTELKREHERYEDLYALFRQQTGVGAQAAAAGAAAAGYQASEAMGPQQNNAGWGWG